MPEDTFCGHGLREDLCEKLKGINPAFLRFPGGCIVEGFSKSTAQRFKRMVGPAWERPGVINLWGYRSTEGLGFHEYLQLCEDLDDVMCALEYAMGDIDTVWGNFVQIWDIHLPLR